LTWRQKPLQLISGSLLGVKRKLRLCAGRLTIILLSTLGQKCPSPLPKRIRPRLHLRCGEYARESTGRSSSFPVGRPSNRESARWHPQQILDTLGYPRFEPTTPAEHRVRWRYKRARWRFFTPSALSRRCRSIRCGTRWGQHLNGSRLREILFCLDPASERRIKIGPAMQRKAHFESFESDLQQACRTRRCFALLDHRVISRLIAVAQVNGYTDGRCFRYVGLATGGQGQITARKAILFRRVRTHHNAALLSLICFKRNPVGLLGGRRSCISLCQRGFFHQRSKLRFLSEVKRRYASASSCAGSPSHVKIELGTLFLHHGPAQTIIILKEK